MPTVMTLRSLIFRELLYRRWNSALSVACVAAAVAGFLGALILLRSFDRETEQWVAAKQEALQKQMARMEDEYRKITKRMGFNVLILPKDQDLSDFYAENYADKSMPEAYAERLAASKNIVTVRHVLPLLQQKLEWPEQKRKILLIGVQARKPATQQRSGEEPLIKPVAPGTAALGYELHHSLGLKAGDTVTFMQKSFKVATLHPERGTIDDITLWIDLSEAQVLLGRQGQINAIAALECECAWADLAKVRKEIQAILPETQVVELAGKALARAEARQEAARNAEEVMKRETRAREDLRRRREDLAAVLVPLVIAVCAVWMGLLAWLNVRERRVEIGTLRALGLRAADVLLIFLGRAAIIGAAGAGAGLIIGVPVAVRISATPGGPLSGFALVGTGACLGVLVLAPLLAMLASWLPALAATRQDPADVLREE